MNELNLDGMALAPGVVETIVSIAANEVEGVASVGSAAARRPALRVRQPSRPRRASTSPWTRTTSWCISVRVDVYYGYVLPDLAANLRQAVADAVASQVGVQVASVDVYIDGIQFAG